MDDSAPPNRFVSPFAFVLTGTPLENRIDETYSIVQYLDPEIFGPLFRAHSRIRASGQLRNGLQFALMRGS